MDFFDEVVMQMYKDIFFEKKMLCVHRHHTVSIYWSLKTFFSLKKSRKCMGEDNKSK